MSTLHATLSPKLDVAGVSQDQSALSSSTTTSVAPEITEVPQEQATATTSTKQPARQKINKMPFIMPDGRPLSAFLHDTNHMIPEKRQSKHKRSKEPSKGWSSSSAAGPRSAVTLTSRSTPLSDAERAELQALEKVGQRRQRRWLNDKLLRDIAGNLTASEMSALFKPVPFGDTGHVSAFTLAAAPEHAHLIDLFRTVDSDRQARVLLKWEEHVNDLRKEGNYSDKPNRLSDAAAISMDAWLRLAAKTKRALRKAPRGCVEEIEKEVAEFGRQLSVLSGSELELELVDGFQRLLGHGLAEYHGMQSFTRVNGNGSKVLVVRKPSNFSGDITPYLCADLISVLEEQQCENRFDTETLRRAFWHEDSRPDLLQFDQHFEQSVPVTVA